MSLIPANTAYLAFAPQVDKDTPASAPVIAIAVEDESILPNPQEIVTAESDSSAQQGQTIRVGAQPGGTFKKYARPSEEDFFLWALLGLADDAGSAPTVHTLNIDAAAPFFTPYLTVWRVWPGIEVFQVVGARLAQAVFSGSPGASIDAEYTVVGREPHYLDDEPDVSGLFIDELPLVWPELTASIDDTYNATVNQFGLTISRGTGRFVGDAGLVDYDVPNGLVAVTGNASVAFEDANLTREALTGSTSGTDLSTAIAEKKLEFDFARSADLGLDFVIAAAQIRNVVTALKVDASPAETTFDFQSKRQADITDVITATVKNAIATADRS